MNLEAVNILQCPVSFQSLRLMYAEETAQLNTEIANGLVYNLEGNRISNLFSDGLITEDKQLIYEIADGIAILLPICAISTNKNKTGTQKLSIETQIIKAFYDNIGWNKTEDKLFEDARRFEDLRPVMQSYISKCHLRLNNYIQPIGKFILDAASGPVQYDEYLTYSENYEYRICVDVSIDALKHAQRRIGNKGIYLLADITSLPIKANVCDAFISLHTLYHVPALHQLKALQELVRVLKKDATGVVVYSWKTSMLMTLFQPRVLARKIFTWFNAGKENSKIILSEDTDFYFHAYTQTWFDKDLKANFPNIQLGIWRTISPVVSRRFIQSWFFGELITATIYSLENKFPNFFGRYGQYPVFILIK